MDPAIYRQMREVEDNHWWFAGRRAVVETVIASLDLPEGARILDVGSGTGGNLAMLSAHGIVTGIEPDPAAAAVAAARNVAPVLKGSIPGNLPVEEGAFDLVIMLDVLEHIADDREALRGVTNLLAEGGTVLVTVPAFPFLWSDHDTLHHHLRRYRRPGLLELFRDAGLAVRLISYYNYWLFPLIALLRILRRRGRPDAVSRDLAIPPAFINRALTRVFSSERFLINGLGFPFGTSLIAVAVKDGPAHVKEHQTP